MRSEDPGAHTRAAIEREHAAADLERERAAAADAAAAEAQAAAARRPTYAVVWSEDRDATPASGTLLLFAGHATLDGAAGVTPRHLEFEADEVRALEFARPTDRLNNRPTVAIALRDGRHLLVAQAIGFGMLTEIVDHLTRSMT